MSKKKLSLFKKGQFSLYNHSSSYSVFAHYYDYIMRDIYYQAWLLYLLDVMGHYQVKPGKILDLACGTGSMTVLLRQAGYTVHGLDSSKEMIQIAREKCQEQKASVRFYAKSMCDFNFSADYDVIFSFNNSINYLLTSDSLTDMFSSVYHSLKPKGIFVFDLTSEINILKNFHQKEYYESVKDFAYLWTNYYDPRKTQLTSTLDFFIHDTEKVFREIHYQKIHSINEIKDLLSVYFPQIDVYHRLSFASPKKKSDAFHFVCQKS